LENGRFPSPLHPHPRRLCAIEAHVVQWSFEPSIFKLGGVISTLALLLLGLAVWPIRK
jgi:hypothetical protein